MIGINGVVFAALRGFVNDRCRFGELHQPTDLPVWPAIHVQVVAIIPEADVCGTDDGTTDETQAQIEYIAKTYGAAWDLRAQGRTALMTVTPPAVREDGFETTDEDTKTWRLVDVYSFHPSSEVTS